MIDALHFEAIVQRVGRNKRSALRYCSIGRVDGAGAMRFAALHLLRPTGLCVGIYIGRGEFKAMEQLSEKLAEPEAIKHDNLSLLYPAIHKEFTEFRAMPFKVTTIYGSMAFLLLGWTFANRAILGWLEIFALMFLLALVTAYSYKYLASIEVHFRECAEALNRMQILLKAYEEGFYAKAFVGRIGASLFSPNWILAGLTREEIGNSKLNVHDFSGTSVRDVGFRYAQYFIALMFSVLTSWLALLLLNVSKLIVIWTDACPYCWS